MTVSQFCRSQRIKGPEKEDILKVLEAIKDPAEGADVINLGLVSGLVVRDGHVSFAFDVGESSGRKKEPLRRACEKAVKKVPGVVTVQKVLTSQKNPKSEPELTKQSSAMGERMTLPGIKTIVAVASGKGGVGKSTVVVNLALALQGLGNKVGLLDADIYGPSIPRLLALKDRPQAKNKRITPLEAQGPLQMFNRVEVPVLGIIENMSSFVCPIAERPVIYFPMAGPRRPLKSWAQNSWVPFPFVWLFVRPQIQVPRLSPARAKAKKQKSLWKLRKRSQKACSLLANQLVLDCCCRHPE